MKAVALVLTAGFVFLSFSSQAQTKTEHKVSGWQKTTPVITKGYYSIGRNAEKLNSTTKHSDMGLQRQDKETFSSAQKGYYSMQNNHTKSGRKISFKHTSAGLAGKASKPVITKGYYSIGRNNEKLK